MWECLQVQTIWTYLTYLLYIEVCDVGQGNWPINKLLVSGVIILLLRLDVDMHHVCVTVGN